MKILHTSDWHIGKRLMGRERLEEQEEVLDEIIELCQTHEIGLVLVAGDIFDTYTPSAEAESLFYEKVKKMAGDNRCVLLISGNHDDGVRLSAIAPFSGEQGVYVVGNARTTVLAKDRESAHARDVRAIEQGKGYIVLQGKDGEKVFIATLPYPNEARFREEKSELPYVERIKGWIDEGLSQNVHNYPSILLAHIFVAGGDVSSSEREIDLGGARAFPLKDLPKCDYIALGHLHKKQRFGDTVYYSGSPLQYAFDESADKSVKIFTLDEKGTQNIQDVPLTSGKKLIRLQAESVETALLLLQKYPQNLIELTLVLSTPLTSNESTKLAAYENLVSVIAQVHSEENVQFESRKGLSNEELFDSFYQTNYNVQPEEKVKTLFLQTLEEIETE